MAGLAEMLMALREAGFLLVLLWLFSLAIVYGILSHINMPKSVSARGVIAITASFLVLLAASAGPAAIFISNLMTVGVVVGFGLMIALIFLEMTGTKAEGQHVFAKHPKFFASALLIIVILIFIGAGGAGILNIPSFAINEPILAMLFFLVVMVLAIWILMKESGGKKD